MSDSIGAGQSHLVLGQGHPLVVQLIDHVEHHDTVEDTKHPDEVENDALGAELGVVVATIRDLYDIFNSDILRNIHMCEITRCI